MNQNRRQNRRTAVAVAPPPSTPPEQPKVPTLRVSSKTDVNKLAGAIAGFAREGVRCMQVRVIGAGADWQLDKAIATAGHWLESAKVKLITVVSWVDIMIDGAERSGLEKTIHCLPVAPPKS